MAEGKMPDLKEWAQKVHCSLCVCEKCDCEQAIPQTPCDVCDYDLNILGGYAKEFRRAVLLAAAQTLSVEACGCDNVLRRLAEEP